MSHELHLKVRGVALWLKTITGQAPYIVNSAMETLLQASDVLAETQRSSHGSEPDGKAGIGGIPLSGEPDK